MESWTRTIIRHRKKVLAIWVVLFFVGGYGAANVGDLLSNRFSVPGAEAERGLDLLKARFGERGDGAFTLVVKTDRPVAASAAARKQAADAAATAARAVKGGRPGTVLVASKHIAYVQINTPLQNADAAKVTPDIRKAIPTIPGAQTYLSGFPAINHDTQKLYNDDLAKGEMIAIPIALLVLAFMFGTLVAIGIPFAFALVTIPSTLGAVWIIAHYMDMAVYVTNIVTLIGFAIAIDYSMLVVFRFREELAQTDSVDDALVATMKTAGRATLFSGGVVAIGLALLVFMPLPFMQSMGVGGLLVPLFSIAAAATFLPALLRVSGRKINSLRVVPKRVLEARTDGRPGFWTRLSRSIMRRPIPYLLASTALMVGLAIPALGLKLTGGDNRGVPTSVESTRGLALLESTIGPGALAPNQIVVDTGRPGGAFDPAVMAAERRVVAQLRREPEIKPQTIQAPVLFGDTARGRVAAQRASLVDKTSQIVQIRAAARGDAGTQASMDLVHRLRERYVPAAHFPPSADVIVTGAPAFGVDFIDRAYGAFPWLVVAVLVLSYLLLLRAFRSVVLPLKAVIMNLLSVSATYGVLVLVFQHGLHDAIGLQGSAQIEAWIPIFLFAMLFGLSMDYEVFLLSRMREEWDKTHDNETAVASGLEHTGRIITAAALIMIAAFSGFTAGSFVGLQEFGLGLSAAIFLDATIVRALLVPALMKLIGDWNWYLPARLHRVLRLKPAQSGSGAA
ncbi:MAG: putative drug exporter of the superfamily [Solirubrobacteraceae bacterium]|jgi:RND superfamily putative drug exporter|nr:putative drug exporter of the superfamily [Solirubrobacteraceae bacterium]